jgi:hypothetical protein
MAKTKAERARDAAHTVSENPYLRRLMEDEDLRDNLRDAYESLRSAGSRMSNGKGPAKALMDDKKVHKELRTAAESLRDASDQLRGKRESHPFRKLLAVSIVGAILALILSEDLRKALLDRLFGAEEEFEYTSTTSVASGGNGSG